jgi:hypothetical protein
MKSSAGLRRKWLHAGGVLLLACAVSPAYSRDNSDTSSKGSHNATHDASASTRSDTAHKSAKLSASASHPSDHKGKKSRKSASRRRGQQKIDGERARQIQAALIREHYLSGQPSGKWDEATQDAMRRYQASNHWQDKTVPDSRALIKLGLGPSNDHLLNPESAMTSAPATGGPTPPNPEKSNQPQR